MSLKNDLCVSSKHMKVEGNEKEGYKVIYHGRVLKYTHSFSLAMDVLFALLVGDYEQLMDYGLNPEEVLGNA